VGEGNEGTQETLSGRKKKKIESANEEGRKGLTYTSGGKWSVLYRLRGRVLHKRRNTTNKEQGGRRAKRKTKNPIPKCAGEKE